MRRGFGRLAARLRTGLALLLAVLASTAMAAVHAAPANAELETSLPVQGDCTVSGSVSFSPLPKLPQATGIGINVSGGCNGVGVGGSGVTIQMSTPALITGSCSAMEGTVSGSVTFTSGSIPDYFGQGTLSGDLASIEVEIANTSQQFVGTLQLADTTLLAAVTCAGGDLSQITVTGVFSFASV